jgi:hypothetical protein
MPIPQHILDAVTRYHDTYRHPNLRRPEHSGIYALFPEETSSDEVQHKWPESWPNADRPGVYFVFDPKRNQPLSKPKQPPCSRAQIRGTSLRRTGRNRFDTSIQQRCEYRRTASISLRVHGLWRKRVCLYRVIRRRSHQYQAAIQSIEG